MGILNEIVESKQTEVERNKRLFPVDLLKESIYYNGPTVSLKHYLTRDESSGIIAEIKRKSPSKGFINEFIDVEEISIGYMQAGAAGLSVLTDKEYFGGSKQDLIKARKFNYCPILRKDFIVDSYQLHEARSWGADVVLLIASILDAEQCADLNLEAQNLGLETIIEVHNEEEIEKCSSVTPSIIGVNNRDLKTFKTDLNTSLDLYDSLPAETLKISESGIETPEDVIKLKKAGYNGFLIGDLFMRNSRPQVACEQFIEELEKLRENAEA